MKALQASPLLVYCAPLVPQRNHAELRPEALLEKLRSLDSPAILDDSSDLLDWDWKVSRHGQIRQFESY